MSTGVEPDTGQFSDAKRHVAAQRRHSPRRMSPALLKVATSTARQRPGRLLKRVRLERCLSLRDRTRSAGGMDIHALIPLNPRMNFNVWPWQTAIARCCSELYRSGMEYAGAIHRRSTIGSGVCDRFAADHLTARRLLVRGDQHCCFYIHRTIWNQAEPRAVAMQENSAGRSRRLVMRLFPDQVRGRSMMSSIMPYSLACCGVMMKSRSTSRSIRSSG